VRLLQQEPANADVLLIGLLLNCREKNRHYTNHHYKRDGEFL